MRAASQKRWQVRISLPRPQVFRDRRSTSTFGLCADERLAVNDDAIVLKTVESILLLEGFSVIASSDPTEALRLMKEPTIDVAVVDIMMPRLSGLDLLKVLRQTKPEVEVVVMTAFGTVATAVEALKGGAYDYLTKPFDSIDDLSGVVARAVEKRRLRVNADGIGSEDLRH